MTFEDLKLLILWSRKCSCTLVLFFLHRTHPNFDFPFENRGLTTRCPTCRFDGIVLREWRIGALQASIWLKYWKGTSEVYCEAEHEYRYREKRWTWLPRTRSYLMSSKDEAKWWVTCNDDPRAPTSIGFLGSFYIMLSLISGTRNEA